MDWAIKILPLKYKEKQKNWFGRKAEISMWVSAFTKPKMDLQYKYIILLHQSCLFLTLYDMDTAKWCIFSVNDNAFLFGGVILEAMYCAVAVFIKPLKGHSHYFGQKIFFPILMLTMLK